MSENDRMRLRDVRAIFRLVGELRELGQDPNVWRPHMVMRLRTIVGAEVVVSSEIHFRKTSTANVMRVVDVGWGCDESGKSWQIHTERDDEKPEAYWLSIWKPAIAAKDDMIPVKPTKPIYGGKAFVLSQVALPHFGTVDQLGLHRSWDQAPFSRSEHHLVRLLHLELGRLWKKDAINNAGDPTNDLPPRLTQTLQELIEGKSEKEIAAKLGLSKHTIHNYVKALHQRLGVSSRGELLAMVGKTSRSGFTPKLTVNAPRVQ
jgi:DNA-binding CsgD family transcriptional regulator